jgi:hypothetical protein
MLLHGKREDPLESAIFAAKAGDPGMEGFSASFPADLSAIHRVLRLSVTLEDIGFLQTNVNALKDVGYVPADTEVAPAVIVADLETVFDILESPLQRIHYWFRRTVWERTADYTADELDLLGVYLKTSLNVGDLVHKDAKLVLLGESKPIDEYYEAVRIEIAKEKPRCRAT